MKQRIVWTTRERQAVAVQTALTMDNFQSLSVFQAIKSAQELARLPDGTPVRVRSYLNTKAAIGPDVIEMIEAERKRLKEARQPTLAQLVNRQHAQMEEAAKTAEADMIGRIGAIMAPAMLSVFRELMAAEMPKMMEQMQEQVFTRLMEQMTAPVPEATNATFVPPCPDETPLRHVILHGPNVTQFHDLKKKYGDKLNLVMARESKDVRRVVRNDSTIVQWTRFTDPLPGDLKRRAAQVLIAPAGMSSGERLLDELAA